MKGAGRRHARRPGAVVLALLVETTAAALALTLYYHLGVPTVVGVVVAAIIARSTGSTISGTSSPSWLSSSLRHLPPATTLAVMVRVLDSPAVLVWVTGAGNAGCPPLSREADGLTG
jgi:hypothetical protein